MPPFVPEVLPVMSSIISPTTPFPVPLVALSVPAGVVGRLLGAVAGMVVVAGTVVLVVLELVLGAVVSVLLPLQPVSRHVVRTRTKARIAVFFMLCLLFCWIS